MKTHFTMPDYAQDMLWLTGANDLHWQITNPAPDNAAAPLTLRWGTPDGSPFWRWETRQGDLSWNGDVHISGHVEVSHMLTANDMDLMIIEMSGGLANSDEKRLPALQDLREAPFKRDVFFDSHDTDFWYAFLLPLESPLVDFAHHALVNAHAVDCYGTLAPQHSGFHQLVGMPLLLESMTLFGN